MNPGDVVLFQSQECSFRARQHLAQHKERRLTGSAITRILIPLEKIGLVRRHPDPRDARVTYTGLTAASRRVLAEATENAESIGANAIAAALIPRLSAASDCSRT